MTLEVQAWILQAFLVFCRVGACMMLMPGFSSPRLPMQVRLFFAIALSLAMLPAVAPALATMPETGTVGGLLSALGAELTTGALLGLLARIFFMALQTLLAAVAQLIGFTGMGGVIAEEEPAPEIATLIGLTATTLIFISGLHWQLLRGIADSYSQIPPGLWMRPGGMLTAAVDQASATFILALRITSPFFLYAVIVNFAVGLTNKLVPQIPVYFIAMPFVTAGGMLLLYLTIGEMLAGFLAAFAGWAEHG
ncbi:flagellar biosynthetic protein FliR [Aquabacter spiritensis]|uniref:Flagellar biosynthetic protein FliR n=1 Tax=Aquabacter spiritensis TaxID=933073 RepID=A0A4R3M5S2_9HYPH|nr:flagellar biosynthetic protein FliR [Aquabacter spiritensis]TCT07953.1 flagellar biosynthetic protein FliR [Aquabacter spiritensis]